MAISKIQHLTAAHLFVCLRREREREKRHKRPNPMSLAEMSRQESCARMKLANGGILFESNRPLDNL